MTYRQRLYYFIVIIILFFIVAPLVILYAAGWRLDFQTRQIQKVGGLVIKTEPRDASVSINGKLLTKKTPLTVNNLKPDEYNIMISMEGYYNWSRTVVVEAGQSWRFDAINLIKNKIPLENASLSDIISASFSPSGGKIAATKDQHLFIINTATGIVLRDLKHNSRGQALEWSPDENYLAVKNDDGGGLVIDVNQPEKIIDLAKEFKLFVTNFKWSQAENSVLYVATTDGLFRINIFQNTKTLISNEKDIWPILDDLFIYPENNQLNFSRSDLKIINQINLPTISNLEFYNCFDNYLCILDTTQKKMFIYDINKNNYYEFSGEVTGLAFTRNNKTIVTYNEHEIWILDLTNGEKEFVTRTSDTINSAAWIKDQNYIIYGQNNAGLTILEETQESPNIYELSVNHINHLAADNAGDYAMIVTDGQLKIFSF
jgi:WD40 repeat protein